MSNDGGSGGFVLPEDRKGGLPSVRQPHVSYVVDPISQEEYERRAREIEDRRKEALEKRDRDREAAEKARKEAEATREPTEILDDLQEKRDKHAKNAADRAVKEGKRVGQPQTVQKSGEQIIDGAKTINEQKEISDLEKEFNDSNDARDNANTAEQRASNSSNEADRVFSDTEYERIGNEAARAYGRQQEQEAAERQQREKTEQERRHREDAERERVDREIENSKPDTRDAGSLSTAEPKDSEGLA